VKRLFLMSMFFLSGCSTIYFGGGDTNTSNITVLENSRVAESTFWKAEEKCTKISSHSYTEGGMFPFIPELISFFCIDCKPDSLRKMAIRDANAHEGNLVVITSWPQHEYLTTDASAYQCNANFVSGLL